MDEGGRKQVKFILKEGLIHIVGNHGLHNNNIEVEVETPELEGYQLFYSINGKDFIELNGKLKITKEDLKNTSLKIIIQAVQNKKIVYYKSDDIALTQGVLFGKKLEESYPEVINLLLKRMSRLEELLGIKEKAIEDIMKLTKNELHKNMLDLVDTFEEINRKGSLF